MAAAREALQAAFNILVAEGAPRRPWHGQSGHGPPAGADRRPHGDRRRRQLSHPQLSPRRRGRRANHRRSRAASGDTARLLAIPGIGKSMAANLQAIAQHRLPAPARPAPRQIRFQHPRTDEASRHGAEDRCVLLVGSPGRQHRPARRGYRVSAAWPNCRAWGKSSSRRSRRASTTTAAAPDDSASTRPRRPLDRLELYLLAFPGFERVTPAGSLRRGRETAGDLDLLVTGPACAPQHTAEAVEYVAAYPGIADLIVKGENKVSFHLARRHAGRCAPAALRMLWRCSAILHRLQGAQCEPSPAGAENGLYAQRVVFGPPRGQHAPSPPPPKRKSTPL